MATLLFIVQLIIEVSVQTQKCLVPFFFVKMSYMWIVKGKIKNFKQTRAQLKSCETKEKHYRMASGLYLLIFDAVYGSRTLSLLLCTLDITKS